MTDDLIWQASEKINEACAALHQRWLGHSIVEVAALGDSEPRTALVHNGHGLTAEGRWTCGLPLHETVPGKANEGPVWQVINAHGRSYLARGHTEAEAIANAAPWFASNVLAAGSGQSIPDPAYAQVGMLAILLTA